MSTAPSWQAGPPRSGPQLLAQQTCGPDCLGHSLTSWAELPRTAPPRRPEEQREVHLYSKVIHLGFLKTGLGVFREATWGSVESDMEQKKKYQWS